MANHKVKPHTHLQIHIINKDQEFKDMTKDMTTMEDKAISMKIKNTTCQNAKNVVLVLEQLLVVVVSWTVSHEITVIFSSHLFFYTIFYFNDKIKKPTTLCNVFLNVQCNKKCSIGFDIKINNGAQYCDRN